MFCVLPLHYEFNKEYKNLPILFGRKKMEEELREKYKQKGLKVVMYEDIQYGRDTNGYYKLCATFVSNGYYICGIVGSNVSNCELCKSSRDCKKLQDFLWGDLFD